MPAIRLRSRRMRRTGRNLRQIVANNAGKDKYEAEEAKAVQSGNGALRIHLAHRLEPGQDVRTGAKQPRDVANTRCRLKMMAGDILSPFQI